MNIFTQDQIVRRPLGGDCIFLGKYGHIFKATECQEEQATVRVDYRELRHIAHKGAYLREERFYNTVPHWFKDLKSVEMCVFEITSKRWAHRPPETELVWVEAGQTPTLQDYQTAQPMRFFRAFGTDTGTSLSGKVWPMEWYGKQPTFEAFKQYLTHTLKKGDVVNEVREYFPTPSQVRAACPGGTRYVNHPII